MTMSEDITDLTNCDREPIHIPGSIQDFGALIALSSDWLVVHRSANLPSVIGVGGELEPGDPLQDVFTAEALDAIKRHLGMLSGADPVERLFGVELMGDGKLFDLAVHNSGRLSVIEIEPHDSDAYRTQSGTLRTIVARLETESGMHDLCAAAAQQLKRLLGFDRVMVYRFHPDQSGEVIAEARESELESFLTLRYPKTDIPQQARELYKRNRFRIISDVHAKPIPIEPERAITGQPLDLSLSTLRSVSPIHLEYLRNMGVEASVSISIVIGGELWGLFACHHYSPRVLPYSLRTSAELFSQVFSLMLERELASQRRIVTDRGRELHDRLMSRIAKDSSLVDNIEVIDQVIGDVIPHDGASGYVEGIYKSRGRAPNEEEFRAIVPALNTAASSQVIATPSIQQMLPKAAAFAGRAVGALVIPVSRRPRDYIVLWRRELQQTVTWAGEPKKEMQYGPNGPRLSPRRSFEAWQESVSGRSADWTAEEMQVAESLRVTLLEVILRLTDQAVQERARAQEQQELLIAELNHRVRNILNLIRGLISQSQHEAQSVSAFAEIVGGRIRALASAHDNITRDNWSPSSLKGLIRNEADAYVAGKADRLILKGPDGLITPEAYTVLALVIHEMTTNSVKYGALCDSSGRLTITTSKDRNGDLRIDWLERGGPPVKPPTRRGFGSTIIERSIPFELRGEAELHYKLGGVEAAFVIPARYVAEISNTDMDEEDAPAPATEQGEGPPQDVLLVEDSMIIALDAEESLLSLGVKEVRVCSSVSAALKAIEQRIPKAALLDYNLGAESSDAVARRLGELGVPFVFATGYGEMVTQLSESGAAGVLKKPYARDDLEDALAQLRQAGKG